MLENAYKNSLKIYGAFDNDKLIGIIRVVGDGYSIIYVQDIIVNESYQHKGIGTKLLEQILEDYKNVYQKILLTDNQPKTVNFYKKLGFIMSSDFDCIAFAIYNA